MTLEIGPRQTVDRAKHPTLGEGRAVYRNGPAFFWPDDGAPVAMRSIDMGRSGSDGSWLRAYTEGGERIELETTGRKDGDRHARMWSPLFGSGWLVSEAWPVYPGDAASEADKARYRAARAWERFEPDNGSDPVRWTWNEMRVGRLAGRPPPYPKQGKAPSPAKVEWDRWRVIGPFEFRDEPPTDAKAHERGPQATLPGVDG